MATRKSTKLDLYYRQLVGLTVEAVAVDSDDEFYGLKFSNGTIAWISCDPEGNGPGHLDIQLGKPAKKPVPAKSAPKPAKKPPGRPTLPPPKTKPVYPYPPRIAPKHPPKRKPRKSKFPIKPSAPPIPAPAPPVPPPVPVPPPAAPETPATPALA